MDPCALEKDPGAHLDFNPAAKGQFFYLIPGSYYLPLNSGFRFSRNARTPSSLSSLEKHRAKRSISRSRPSRRLVRAAFFTEVLAIANAIGLFSAILLAISIVFASSSAAGWTSLTSPRR